MLEAGAQVLADRKSRRIDVAAFSSLGKQSSQFSVRLTL